MRISITRILIAAAISLLLSGCAFSGSFSKGFRSTEWSFNGTIFGGLYSHTVEPLSVNREPTHVEAGEKRGGGQINQFQHPLTSVISIRLGRNGLGDVARKHGIETIYYADIERWSFAFGLWSREVVHIYGR